MPNSVWIECALCLIISIGWYLHDRRKKKPSTQAKKALAKVITIKPKNYGTDAQMHVLSGGMLLPLFWAKEGKL